MRKILRSRKDVDAPFEGTSMIADDDWIKTCLIEKSKLSEIGAEMGLELFKAWARVPHGFKFAKEKNSLWLQYVAVRDGISVKKVVDNTLKDGEENEAEEN